MSGDVFSAAEEARSFADMVIERHPEMREAIEARLAEAVSEIEAVFQPYIDLAEGKITDDEFSTVIAERRAAEEAQRRAAYGDPDDEGEWQVPCETCSTPVVFDELPPLYVECEDCENDEDES